MTSRKNIVHTVSTSQPTIAQIGDEWFNPTTNTLYKNISVSATNPQWVEFFSTLGSTNSGTFGNLTVTGNLNVSSGGSLNVTNLTQNINFSMPGTVTAPVTGTAAFYPTRNMTLTTVNANLGVAPSGNFVFQILKNGVSIGINFTITAQNPLMSVVYLSGISLLTTDRLTINVIAGSANGQDFAVKISYI